MSQTEKLVSGSGAHLQCLCRECRRKTKHEVLAEVTRTGNNGLQWRDEYQIVKCMGCESIAFRRAQGTEEDNVPVGEDGDGWIYEYQPLEELFPDPRSGRQAIGDSKLLPEPILRIYDESIFSLNNRQDVLCGIGIRAILEAVCNERQAQGGTLLAKIDSLVKQQVLTPDGAAILHKLRVLGNRAAHEVKPHTTAELGLALDVIDHLLEGVYVLPMHATKTLSSP